MASKACNTLHNTAQVRLAITIQFVKPLEHEQGVNLLSDCSLTCCEDTHACYHRAAHYKAVHETRACFDSSVQVWGSQLSTVA